MDDLVLNAFSSIELVLNSEGGQNSIIHCRIQWETGSGDPSRGIFFNVQEAFRKNYQIIDFRPKLRGSSSPPTRLGNPGSATGYYLHQRKSIKKDALYSTN